MAAPPIDQEVEGDAVNYAHISSNNSHSEDRTWTTEMGLSKQSVCVCGVKIRDRKEREKGAKVGENTR